jgi:hypothetical protein
MKLHPMLWALVLIVFLVPVVFAILPKGDSRPPDQRFPFLAPATLEKVYAPHYTRSMKYLRGNSYVYLSSEGQERVVSQFESAEGWKQVGLTRFGAILLRHKDGPRAYVSRFESAEHPEAKSNIVLVDSIRRVGWVERQVARAWFQMASSN